MRLNRLRSLNYRILVGIFLLVVMLLPFLPTTNLITTSNTLPNKIPKGVWQWAPEGPPTPGGVYWNYWSSTNLWLFMWQYLPLAIYVHNENQFIPLLATNWTWNGSEMIVTLRHPYYWDTPTGPKPFTAWDVWTTYIIGIRLFGWFSTYGLYNVSVINNYTVAFLFKGSTYKNFIRTESVVLAPAVGAPYFQFGNYAATLYPLNTSNPALSSYLSNLTSAIEKLNVTPTSNGFYLPNVSSMNDEYMVWNANPYFEQAFPNSSLKYYPEMITYWSSGNTQSENFLVSGICGYGTTAIPLSIYDTLKGEGMTLYMADTYGGVGFYLNPKIYPFNISLVRQALYHVVNLTELAAAYAPDYEPGPVNFAGIPLGFQNQFESVIPSSFWEGLNNYTYNLTLATQLLEKAGLTEKNGEWYLPNGSQFQISILAPNSLTDWVALSQELANQFDAFGIKSQVYEITTSTYYSDFFSGAFEVGPFFTPFTSIVDAWRIGSIIPQPPFNLSLNTWYMYEGHNYTINVTQVMLQMHSISSSSPLYINDTEKLMAWYNYWLPAIADVEKVEPVELNPFQANYQAILNTNNSTFISTTLFPFIAYDFEYMGPVIGFLDGYITPPNVTPPIPSYVYNVTTTTTTVPQTTTSTVPSTTSSVPPVSSTVPPTLATPPSTTVPSTHPSYTITIAIVVVVVIAIAALAIFFIRKR
ncbi:hypothetical protein HS7_14940 [Sulfolobales archaeon HS-7]|nr:hypothetical protein HS7_14940 [Sulfolobales archaeon HS-7]